MHTQLVQRLLKEGIAALQRGERERGRVMLLQVVEADERNEPAWLWLSQAVDDPNDKLVALENVLAINPDNAQAREMLEAVRRQMGLSDAEPTPVPTAPPAHTEPPPVFTSADPDDDPLQCAYCGYPAAEGDEACPRCKRNLMVLGPWHGKFYYNSLVVLSGVALQMAVLQTLGPVFSLAVAQGLDAQLARAVANFGPIGFMFGDLMYWAAHNYNLPLTATLIRAAIWMVLFFMLYTDMDLGYPAAAGVGLLDIALDIFGGITGLLGPGFTGLNVILSLATALIGSIAVASRRQARVRLLVKPDRDAHGAMGMYQRGREYGRQGKWALAALHWQKAVALKPSEIRFYKELGLALARLGRLSKALGTLEEGARRAPDDAEFGTLIQAVRAEADKNNVA